MRNKVPDTIYLNKDQNNNLKMKGGMFYGRVGKSPKKGEGSNQSLF